ncbi:MAG: response regulator [Verrucomicrobia bacterium]|nr:response regulator [Verrucomicrobiota bacterium]
MPEETVSNPARPNEPPAAVSRRGTLLIADDEEGPRESLRMVFKSDYDLLVASDGPTAIELARQNRVDVALLDIRMGRMSGIDLLEQLKRRDPGVEVIMMTAFETTDTLRKAIQLRALDYINKPFDLPFIRALVGEAMRRRRLESEMISSAEKVDALVAELQDQKIEQQMARTRGDIYASIIHDINNPLAVISGFVQLLTHRVARAERLENEDLEFVRQKLHTIARQVGNCVEISRRYLSFLQRQPGETAKVSVNTLLTDFEHLARVHPSRQDSELVVKPVAVACSPRMNGTDFIQVLLNLTTNAFQAGERPCRVEVAGELLTKPLDLGLLKDTPEERLMNLESFDNTPPVLMLTVRDDGPGIPSEYLTKIFQPYFTSKDPSQGTGLGLSIVLRLVKQVGGLLQLKSAPGKGTVFTLYFPAELKLENHAA